MPEKNIEKNKDREIVTTRVLDTPVEMVYKAWTDPVHLKKWWGPAGFTNTFQEFDLRPGGRWKFIMHGPEQGNYNNECEFISIQPPHFLSWKRHSKPLFDVMVNFEGLPGAKTNLIFKMIFDTPEECNKLKKFVVEKNEENFDKLEVELNNMKQASK